MWPLVTRGTPGVRYPLRTGTCWPGPGSGCWLASYPGGMGAGRNTAPGSTPGQAHRLQWSCWLIYLLQDSELHSVDSEEYQVYIWIQTIYWLSMKRCSTSLNKAYTNTNFTLSTQNFADDILFRVNRAGCRYKKDTPRLSRVPRSQPV